MTAIHPARTPADLAEAAALFRVYAASLEIDLSYQGFEAELAALPGRYAPPGGELLLARDTAGAAVGVVALRPLDEGCCEIKWLYVAPAGRRLGLGRALAERIVAAARAIGYREARLDTLPTMSEALAVYRRLGFRETAPYYETPVAGTIFMAVRL